MYRDIVICAATEGRVCLGNGIWQIIIYRGRIGIWCVLIVAICFPENTSRTKMRYKTLPLGRYCGTSFGSKKIVLKNKNNNQRDFA